MADLFAEVILPFPLHDTYTYRIPAGLESQIHPGKRCIVSFGKKRSFSALIISVHSTAPTGIELKDIESVLDENPVIFGKNLELWNWIAQYYICQTGDVMKAALPPGMRLASDSIVTLLPSADLLSLTEPEKAIVQCFGIKTESIEELSKSSGKGFSFRILKHLIDKGIVQVEEKVQEQYKPVFRTFIMVHPEITSVEKWENAHQSLNRSEKQKELMSFFAVKANLFTPDQKNAIDKKELLESGIFTDAMIKSLISKKILTVRKEQISRLTAYSGTQLRMNQLSEPQQHALEEIKNHFQQKHVVLLHGITASGKTEIYIHLANEVISQHRQVLYLLPEIGLTPQIEGRFSGAFGNRVGVYHSGMSSPERHEIWNSVLSFRSDKDNPRQLIIGTRSAIFLPFSELGLIIVDEEHDSSYKQSDPSPRYNARDMAVVMGHQHKCPVLLGSATPSFESYQNALTGKYGLVTLFSRFGTAPLPEIRIADIQRAWKRREMRSFLTPDLYAGIQNALKSGEQVILFQNRRGYSTFMECKDCGKVPHCINCDVCLTYHRFPAQLICHYCGYTIQIPQSCPECGSKEIQTRGFGTERVEEEIAGMFPEARIARMDRDSTRSKTAFGKIIRLMEQRKTDILIGTQMVTKGLDIENVSLVGILNADNMLNFPDFRAHERAFQHMYQVSGRSGRKDKKGIVIIQTSQPTHPVIRCVSEQDYEGLFHELKMDRKLFRYPPFFRMIKIIIKHKNPARAENASRQLAEILAGYSLFTLLGPASPLIGKKQQWHIREIWLKSSREQKMAAIQSALKESIDRMNHFPGIHSLKIQFDVDPL
jgi:primosomal protein N' (replication factor Y) (superfamily II helicase)